jgi:predicted transcriptional regulator
MINTIINNIITIHNNDFERLWYTITKTDKKILITLAFQEKVSIISQPTSTIYSGLKRLLTNGYIIKNKYYEFDDPFFKKWIVEKLS